MAKKTRRIKKSQTETKRPTAPTLDEFISFKRLGQVKDKHWMTCYRWATRGIKVGRSTVKLRTIRETNRRLTTLRWYNEFMAAQQETIEAREAFLAPNRDSVEQQLEAELAG